MDWPWYGIVALILAAVSFTVILVGVGSQFRSRDRGSKTTSLGGELKLPEGYVPPSASLRPPPVMIGVGQAPHPDSKVSCPVCDSGMAAVHVCPRILKPMVRSLLKEILAEDQH